MSVSNNESNDQDYAMNNTNNSHYSEDDWQAFMQDHEDELADIANSNIARKFSKTAKKREQQAQFQQNNTLHSSASNTTPSHTTLLQDDPHYARNAQHSLLDTLDDLDAHSTFTPPQSLRWPKLTLRIIVISVLTVLGVIGIIASIAIPTMPYSISTIAFMATIVGFVALFMEFLGKHHEE